MQAIHSPSYLPNPKHRSQNLTDSQWEIPEQKECASFLDAWGRGWCLGSKGWGLHVVDDRAAKLGITEVPRELSFIAKFVSGAEPIKWHGYPADRRKNQDIPPREILNDWRKKNLLRPAAISKIGKGLRCAP
jgi:hypothetical protein